MSRPKQQVCIVGAGISGLVSAKVLEEDGFAVTLFEKASDLGGVWRPDNRYPGVRANNSAEGYAFTDFPYPADAEEFPTGENIYDYLRAYAVHHDLERSVRFSTEVVEVRRNRADADRRFTVTTATGDGGERREHAFDFVVVCNGTFSTPSIPPVANMERFEGRSFHSSAFRELAWARGKRVVIVGAGKSAVDCAQSVAELGASTTLVMRRTYWMLPRYMANRPVDTIMMRRFAEMWMTYHTPTPLERALHGRAKPLVSAWWALFNKVAVKMMGMPEDLVPEKALPFGLEKGGVIDAFFEQVNAGKIRCVQSSVTEVVGPDEIALANGERLRADIIIFATGWKRTADLLEPALRAEVVDDEGRFRLYRQILVPEEPRLAFVGYQSSIASQLTSEVAAHWLAHLFSGAMDLPSVGEMQSQISTVLDWQARTFPQAADGFYVGPFTIHYLDDLLGDMGVPKRRASSVGSDFFGPLLPARYRSVGEQRKRRG